MVKHLKVNMLLAVLSVLGLEPVFSSPTTHIKLFVVANASAILMLVSKKKKYLLSSKKIHDSLNSQQ
jgi:hypothetical protein